MDCEGFRSRLGESPDDGMAEPAATHLASCEACRQSLARAEVVRRILAGLPRETPDPELDARVLTAARAPRGRKLPLLLRIAAAILVLGSGGLGFHLLRQSPPEYEPIALRVVCDGEDGSDSGDFAMEEMFGPDASVTATGGGGNDGSGR